MKIATELGQRIRKYRKGKGLTQEELSSKCNLHPTYIGQIERGEKCPSIESVYKICKALELKTAVLFEKIDDFATDAEETTVPLKAYAIIEKMSFEDQKAMLTIVENAASLNK